MLEKTKITKQELFNLVAPIHIYHKADVLMKTEAQIALNKLRRLSDDKLVIEFFGVDDVLLEDDVKKVDYLYFWRTYDKLFEDIVEEKLPELTACYDFYGAKAFESENRAVFLVGDKYDCFPFYESVPLLEEKLQDLTHEIGTSIN